MFLKFGLGALALVLTTNPAQANEVAAATTQIAGTVSAQSTTATGDREFTELFASWKSIDTTGVVETAPQIAAVSIPTGMPLHDATLTSDFGMRTHPILGGRRNHKGVDLAQPTGTPVYATADGIVSRAEIGRASCRERV